MKAVLSTLMVPRPGEVTLVWTGPVKSGAVRYDDLVNNDSPGVTDQGRYVNIFTVGLNKLTVDAKYMEETMRTIEEKALRDHGFKVLWKHVAMAQLSTLAVADQLDNLIDEELAKLPE